MGNQQMLLIVIAMIIVAVAFMIAVSIFDTVAYVNNKRALSSEVYSYLPYVVKYWDTSKMLGGAAHKISLVSTSSVAGYIGFNSSSYSTKSENGELRVMPITNSLGTDSTITIKALGKEKRKGKYAMITATVSLKKNVTQRYKTAFSDASSW